jgi:hypothetical protein
MPGGRFLTSTFVGLLMVAEVVVGVLTIGVVAAVVATTGVVEGTVMGAEVGLVVGVARNSAEFDRLESEQRARTVRERRIRWRSIENCYDIIKEVEFGI